MRKYMFTQGEHIYCNRTYRKHAEEVHIEPLRLAKVVLLFKIKFPWTTFGIISTLTTELVDRTVEKEELNFKFMCHKTSGKLVFSILLDNGFS